MVNARDMPGCHLDDFGAAAALIEDLALADLRLQFDVYHRQILHGDVLEGLEALLPITGHVQIASAPGRNDWVRASSTTFACCARSTRSATAAMSAANTARSAAPKTASSGATRSPATRARQSLPATLETDFPCAGRPSRTTPSPPSPHG